MGGCAAYCLGIFPVYFVGQDGILPPIGNRPDNFSGFRTRRITNPPQVTNLPHNYFKWNSASAPFGPTAHPVLLERKLMALYACSSKRFQLFPLS
jgi:hypothetical protein